ncbi:hypothetical protein D7Z54_33615 [Salibacterium salarium]|uniref:DUF4376 domain-containing protein n=1 Tax=Salibacterium salarium TaxID=284579 RepID=A0A3R9PEF5_9BACI|nr:hypothetical protein [Salibacterium salarium]RSL28993.1 hypothetical protein D7Z54_33615 [Salibacterium salarium]
MGTVNIKTKSEQLEEAKERKIKELSRKCQEVIIYDFVASNGNGYRLTVEDQLNMQGQKNDLDDDTDITSVDWMTIDDVDTTHTRDEWLAVYKEAFQHKNDSIWHNKAKRDDVNACTTIDEVDAVTW